MGAEKGKNVLLKVGDGAGSEVFTTLGGQKSTKIQLGKETYDASDKSIDWKKLLAGKKNATVTVQGVAQWPDTTGLDRLRAVFVDDDDTVNCRLVVNTSGDYWGGAFIITSCDLDGPDSGSTEYGVTLQAAGALTYTEV